MGCVFLAAAFFFLRLPRLHLRQSVVGLPMVWQGGSHEVCCECEGSKRVGFGGERTLAHFTEYRPLILALNPSFAGIRHERLNIHTWDPFAKPLTTHFGGVYGRDLSVVRTDEDIHSPKCLELPSLGRRTGSVKRKFKPTGIGYLGLGRRLAHD